MKFSNFILIGLLLTGSLFADFAEKILERNGDVYVLVTRKDKMTTSEVGVYKFTRVTGYGKAEKLAPGNATMQTNMQYYEGLAVDKFGHVKLFRNKGDENPVNLLTETRVHPNSPAAWPGWEPISFYDKGGAAAPDTFVNASPPGWVYVVEPNGKYGWYKLYNWVRVGLPGNSGGMQGYKYDAPNLGAFPEGTEFIPKVENGGPVTNIAGQHGGFWRSDCNRGSYAFQPNTNGLFFPPINCFWMVSAGIHQAGRRIDKVEKAVTALYLDTYLTSEDNLSLSKAKDEPKFGSITAGVDFFNGGEGEYYDEADSALNTSLAFTQSFLQYNKCGDMCGQAGTPSAAPPIVINKARAKFSSGGASQLQQRSYMVKTRSANNGKDLTTWVVGLTYDAVKQEYAQKNIVKWEGGVAELGPGEVAGDGVLSTSQGAGIGNKRILIYDFPGEPDIIRTVQTSKRFQDQDDTKDYLYVTNMPPSHFNVSSSFWGTGGVVWWAKELGGNQLELNYEQYNHQKGTRIRSSDGSPVKAENVESLYAIGADGDNFVYILHAGKGTDNKGGVDGPSTMEALISPKTRANLQALKDSGRLVSPVPALPIALDLCDTPAGPCNVSAEIKVFAGPIVEKIAPLPGSKPLRIGVIPLKETGQTCTAIMRFAAPTDSDFTLVPFPGGERWSCMAGSAGEALAKYKFEMAIINVANPPATGGDMKLDIVNATSATQDYMEDTEYRFEMENPPVFDGTMAQLGLVPDAELSVYGNIHMISNYDVTGIERLKDFICGNSPLVEPGSSGAALSGCRKWFDNDGRVGKLLPSFVSADLLSGNLLHTKVGGEGGGSASGVSATQVNAGVKDSIKTLRWRWRVEAKTPPQSLKNFNAPNCEPLKKGESPDPDSDPKVRRDWPHANGAGVMYDSCWQDLTQKGPDGHSMVPGELTFKPNDPGDYEITLMFGGLRFDADGLTFLDNPDSVRAEVAVTWYTMPIHVGAREATGGPEIRDIVVASNDLADNKDFRLGILVEEAVLKSKFTSETSLVGPEGRLPAYPVAYYSNSGGPSSQPLVLSWDHQDTPIVAEAEIDFFKMKEIDYINQELYGAQGGIQTKSSGVGAWDYSYPQTKDNLGNLFGALVSLVEKKSTFPSNFAPGGDGSLEAEDVLGRRGYDASGNPETSNGKNGSGIVLGGASFSNAHQGTLASCKEFESFGSYMKGNPDCLLKHPESLYTWWEIKYAWFLRFRQPDGTVRKKVIKTGNLAEVFLLNALASTSPGWKTVAKAVAPTNLVAQGTDEFSEDSLLMKFSGVCNNSSLENCRKIKVRIPLLQPGSLLAGEGVTELDAPLKSWNSGADFNTIYSAVHPLQFDLPSDPGVYELGLQIFYPIMNWMGRGSQKNAAGEDEFAYFDAVYWGSASEAAKKPVEEDRPGLATDEYTFGEDKLVTWNRFGTIRNVSTMTALDEEAKEMGLKLAKTTNIKSPTGGFMSGGAGTDDVTYQAPGGARDDFTDIVVLDLEPPELSLISGNALSAAAGGVPNGDIFLEVKDNHAFSRFAGHTSIGGEALMAPALVQFSREIGFDPRNRMGLGLKPTGLNPEPAFGMNLSETILEEGMHLAYLGNAQSQFALDSSERKYLGRATPWSIDEPGFTYKPLTLKDDFSSFFFPPLPSQNLVAPVGEYPDAYIFVDSKDAPNRVLLRKAHTPDSDEPVPLYQRNNETAAGVKHYYHPPRHHTKDNEAIVRTEELDVSEKLPMLLMAMFPSIEDGPYRIQTQYNGFLSSLIEFVASNPFGAPVENYSRFSDECLRDTDPVDMSEGELKSCEIKTRWRIPAKSLVSPYFMDGPSPLILRTYAKAREVRITPNLPAPSLNAEWNFDNSWKRRQGAENRGAGTMEFAWGLEGNPELSGTLQNRIDRVLDSEAQARLTEVGTITVTDNQAPNFRVILTETKNRTQMEFAVMASQSYDPEAGEKTSDRVMFFRTQDNRANLSIAENAVFEQQAITRFDLTDADRLNLNVATLAGGSDIQEKVYRIPEDVRFEVRVLAGDNRELENIYIRISGGHAGDWAHPDGVAPVETQYEFPEVTTDTKRIYQQMKMANRFHFYPKAGFYDVIKIEVFDQPAAGGNGSVLYIPVEVINQSVFFRKIGSEQSRR